MLDIPSLRVGEIAIGQTVILELEEFSIADFGLLKSRIQSISPIDVNDNYRAYIELEIIEMESKNIKLRENMSGEGRVLLKSESSIK